VRSELATAIRELHAALRAGRLSSGDMARTASFRQFAEWYIYGNFWRRHQEFIQNTARNLDSEDLLAVAMVALVEAMALYDETQGGRPLLCWLTFRMYQACHNEVRGNYERARWNVSAPATIQVLSVDEDGSLLEGRVAECAGPLLDPEDELERAVIQDAVQRLPRLYREIIRMRHYEGRSFAEIGQRLWPVKPENPGTVQRHYRRAPGAQARTRSPGPGIEGDAPAQPGGARTGQGPR
jgi:RNA polymerase sigma factor (sigma-70 family)